jgi:hypothetical protein
MSETLKKTWKYFVFPTYLATFVKFKKKIEMKAMPPTMVFFSDFCCRTLMATFF